MICPFGEYPKLSVKKKKKTTTTTTTTTTIG
jgi:hypothetical protein